MSPAHTDEPSALDLLDEAIRMLRAIPVSAWSIYCTGAVPFWAGVLVYWTLLVHGGMASQLGSAVAVALVGLYVWKRVWHMRFGSHLQAFTRSQSPPRWGVRDWIAAAGIQTRWACTSLALAPLSLATIFPSFFHWFGHESLAVGALRPAEEQATLPRRVLRMATEWPGQVHIAAVVLSGIAGVLWINFAVVLAVAPWMIEWWTGWRPAFASDSLWMLHPTFAAVVTVLTLVALDPLVKAFTALRVHRLESRSTGEDLRIEWQRVRRRLPTLVTTLVLGWAAVSIVRAAPMPPTPAQPAEAQFHERLDAAIRRVYEQPHIAWRLQPPVTDHPKPSWLRTQLRKFSDWLDEQLTRWWRWLNRALVPESSRPSSTYSVSDWARRVAIVLIPVFGLVGIGWLLQFRRARRRPRASAASGPTLTAAAAAPDLDRTLATEHSADTWWALAQQLATAHDYRRAVRAAFLGLLAEAAARHWVDVVPSRTNRDYIAQLQRRLRDAVIVQHFHSAVRLFESSWYGAHPATPEALAYLRELGDRLRGTAVT